MKLITVKLAGKEHKIQELPRAQNKEWRKQLETDLMPLASFLSDMPDLEVKSGKQAEELIKKILGQIDDGIDTAAGLVEAYAVSLDLEWDQVYESEIIEAFVGVLTLAYPFGSVIPTIQQLISLGQSTK